MTLRELTLSVAYGDATPPAPARGAGPVEWFADQAARRPEAPAVVQGEDVWTFRTLDLAAERMARALRELVVPGEIVGVRMERSAHLVAVVIGLARAGAVYLPLGAHAGRGRIEALTAEAGVRLVVTDADLAPPAGWEPARPARPLPDAVRVDRRPTGDGRDGDGADPARHPDARYAVTTSGSTGRPKIVLVGDEALGNVVRWYCARHELGQDSRVSLFVGTTFDPHLKELWSALSSGAALCVAPEDTAGSTAELFRWWRDAGVTSAILPTPLADLAFAGDWPRGLALRHVSVGGDRMRVRPQPDCTATVHNMYGPAEATVVTTAHRVSPDGEGPIPIGSPVAGAVVLVTDDAGRVLPRGLPGELRVGGTGLAIGYLDPLRTAERFVPAPDEAPGVSRVYRTGDKAVMRPDGTLEFLGRVDDQVKVSGVRVEPAEVESALEAQPAVRRAVVVPVPDSFGGTRLVAFVRTVPGAAEDAGAVLRAAHDLLPPQAAPGEVRFVADFPLNANGKTDRGRLAALASEPHPDPADASAGHDAATGTAAPARLAAALRGVPGDEPEPGRPSRGSGSGSGTERFLLDTCRKLLDRPGLTAADNFVAAGGTSLAAARLLAAIEQTLGVRVRAAEVLRQPDLSSLAALLDGRTRTPSAR
ncbi:amino acid adenylation domain-containing protein [Streptomyces sp. NPDC047928]|uniref:amino acid adenylation domain-containing protein n=1 Tax=unclassified Streptomyces TaxID=2593676 RepID=UPI003713700A